MFSFIVLCVVGLMVQSRGFVIEKGSSFGSNGMSKRSSFISALRIATIFFIFTIPITSCSKVQLNPISSNHAETLPKWLNVPANAVRTPVTSDWNNKVNQWTTIALLFVRNHIRACAIRIADAIR